MSMGLRLVGLRYKEYNVKKMEREAGLTIEYTGQKF